MTKTEKSYWKLFLGISVLALIYLARACFSFCQSDEVFYLSTVKRIYMGDRLIIDEWHVSQLFSLIILPIFSLYKRIVPSLDGIILFFRIAQMVLSYLTAFFFLRLCSQKEECYSYFLSSAVILTYARCNIGGISYYNIFALSIIWLFILGFPSAKNDKTKPKLFGIGIALAIGVICMPYYLPLAIIYVFCYFKHNRRDSKLWAIMGGISLIAIYALFYITPSLLSDQFLPNLKCILNDPEHTGLFIYHLKSNFSWLLTSCFGNGIVRTVLLGEYLLLIVISIEIAISKKWEATQQKNSRIDSRTINCFVVLLCCCIFSILLRITLLRHGMSWIFYIFTIWSIPIWICASVISELENYQYFVLMYVYGILASLAFSIGSNVPDSWSVGFLTSTVVTLLVMFRFASWLKDYAERKLCILNVIPFKCLSNIIIGLCIAGMCFTRICGVYRDAPLNQLNRRINCGPAKGLYSTEEHVNQYNRVIHMLDEIENMIPNSNSHIFFSKLLPWAYLCTDFKYGTPTSWRHPLDDLRVMQYYDIHPEKAPDIIVKFSPEIGGYRNSLFSEEREGEQTPNANSENISQFSKYGSYSLCEIGYTDIADIWVK